MLDIKNLKFTYDGSAGFDFSLFLKEGEIAAIVGESGSGKSTFLDLLSGFLRSSSGSIRLDGQAIDNLPVEKRPLTILFQNYNLFEHLNVLKNVSLGNDGVDKKSIKSILKQVGLGEFINQKVSLLSGGQQQRVALARAMLRNKPILLLDEPFSGLDKDTKITMLELVRKITKEKKLHTIMVTHDKFDSDLIADKVYKVKNQKLTEI